MATKLKTKAQRLAAFKTVTRALGISADEAREFSGAKRGKNPAPRIGTKKPKRASQREHVTKTGKLSKAASSRLIMRREANKKKGYFPNPRPPRAKAGNVELQEYNAKAKRWQPIRVRKDSPGNRAFMIGLSKKTKGTRVMLT